ncbi:hypothetical protein [Streptococcus merionis]|uniref:hypothetical protein n=1 Tax=Streptococcus merionis TaxID=400065 RepID=UPI0035149678
MNKDMGSQAELRLYGLTALVCFIWLIQPIKLSTLDNKFKYHFLLIHDNALGYTNTLHQAYERKGQE